MPTPNKPLAGVGVLVTRPTGQAEPLIRLLEEAGARAIHLPALAIAPPQDPQRVAAVVARLAASDLAIFVSANAVRHGLALIGGPTRLPARLRIAAVGEATARALHAAGVERVIAPAQRFDSEALLALPELAHVAGQNIVIFRGEGGRELLTDGLAARGARVAHVECYRRVKPDVDLTAAVRDWDAGRIDIATVTSVEALRNLHELLGPEGQRCLARTPLVVVSSRIAQAARDLGLAGEILVSRAASDAAILDAVLAWQAGHKAP
jgi:uroporphyrinogen-III synthase